MVAAGVDEGGDDGDALAWAPVPPIMKTSVRGVGEAISSTVC